VKYKYYEQIGLDKVPLFINEVDSNGRIIRIYSLLHECWVPVHDSTRTWRKEVREYCNDKFNRIKDLDVYMMMLELKK
jgi:hypothetical protein